MEASHRILAVDDDDRARELLRTLIESEGGQAILARDGWEAVQLALDIQPDAVLLDVMMPGVDGFEVCRMFREHPLLSPIPVLLLTALDDRASRLRGLEVGADDFITKPLDMVEMRLRLRTLRRLNRYRLMVEQASRYEAAVRHAPDGFVLAELDGAILLKNGSFQRMLHPDAARTAVLWELFAPDASAILLADAADREMGKPTVPRELPLERAATEGTVVEVTCGFVPWQGRRVIQVQMRDVTRSRMLEAHVQRMDRIEVIGQLSGSIVHDMNNLLMVITGNAQIASRMCSADGQRYLAAIQQAVERGSKMLRQLLLFARGADAEPELKDLRTIVVEVHDLFAQGAGDGIRMELDVGDQPLMATVDSTQVHQMLMNLCVNARDAMPGGGLIRLEARRVVITESEAASLSSDAKAGDYVAVSVRDSGTGIPPHVMAKLFDPFFTTKPKGKGTGLGLATVLRLARRHGGFVAMSTELGKGSCFTCYFAAEPTSVAAIETVTQRG
jgi:PAS domain S-box-containing protein